MPSHNPFKTRKTTAQYPEWMRVYDAYAKFGIKVIPINFDDSTPESGRDIEFLVSEDQASCNKETIRQWGITIPNPYWAILVGEYCKILVVRVIGEKGNRTLSELETTFGRLNVSTYMTTPFGKDYFYKYNSTDELTLLRQDLGEEIDFLYNNEFIVVAPSRYYEWESYEKPSSYPFIARCWRTV